VAVRVRRRRIATSRSENHRNGTAAVIQALSHAFACWEAGDALVAQPQVAWGAGLPVNDGPWQGSMGTSSEETTLLIFLRNRTPARRPGFPAVRCAESRGCMCDSPAL